MTFIESFLLNIWFTVFIIYILWKGEGGAMLADVPIKFLFYFLLENKPKKNYQLLLLLIVIFVLILFKL